MPFAVQEFEHVDYLNQIFTTLKPFVIPIPLNNALSVVYVVLNIFIDIFALILNGGDTGGTGTGTGGL